MKNIFTKPNIMTVCTVLLILAVTLPSWVGMTAVLTGQLSGETLARGEGLGVEFYVMLFEPTTVWETGRSGLALMVAAIAALDMMSGKIGIRAGVVMAALLLAFVPLAILFVYLGNPNRAADIWNLIDQTNMTSRVEDTATFNRGWNNYLLAQIQLLGAQFALFFGLQRRS